MMPAEVISYFLNHQNSLIRLHFQVVLQCAPLLKGLKASSLLSLEESLYASLPEMFCGTDISCKVLMRRKERDLILFYRAEELKEYVGRVEVRRVLNGFGYQGMDWEDMLDYLKERVSSMDGRTKKFPHEIGAFLGYPAKDVEGFIKNNGKKYIFSGYWKVYHDPSGAARTFFAFDKAKEYAVYEFLSGKSLREIFVGKTSVNAYHKITIN